MTSTEPPVTDPEQDEINELIRLGRKYKWATGDSRRQLERGGVNIVRSDFYSETPTLDDIAASYEYEEINGQTLPVYDDASVFDLAKITRNSSDLIDVTKNFNPPLESDSGFAWKNTQFSSLDALTYFGLIKKSKPARIIEIGSGFSTHIAHRALSENGTGTLTCIDPEPRIDITQLDGISFQKQPVQQVPADWFQQELKAGDILFYDGSHTVKTGSDTVYFYLKVLPYLPSGVMVHAHDVCLPYPRNRRAMEDAKIYWNEQYLLMAHLLNTARYEVEYANNLLTRQQPDLAQSWLGGRFFSYGVSIWFRVK